STPVESTRTNASYIVPRHARVVRACECRVRPRLFRDQPMTAAPALFSPIALADVKLAIRVVVSPMCQYSADDGCANDWHLTHLGLLANCGAGLVIVEATHVERHGRLTHGCTWLYSDDNEAAMARVVAHCRRHGTAKLG